MIDERNLKYQKGFSSLAVNGLQIWEGKTGVLTPFEINKLLNLIIKIMTVLQLINQLKKLPKNKQVFFKDHDQHEYEVNNNVNSVSLIDFDKAPQHLNWMNLKGELVVLSS